MFVKNIIPITLYEHFCVPLLWTLYFHNLTELIIPVYSCFSCFSVINGHILFVHALSTKLIPSTVLGGGMG